MFSSFMKVNLQKRIACGEGFHAGYFIRWQAQLRMKGSIMKIYSLGLAIFLFSCAPSPTITPITESELFNKTVPAIVVVYSFDKNNELMGQGTGFLLTKTGIIATNFHVIDGSYSLRVAFTNGEKYDVKEIVAKDEHRDIAILNVNGFDLPIIKLGNSNNISIGEKVIAIGNPLGLSNTLSSGIISGIRTDLEDYKLIQTTTPISPGSSGGPLLNMKGEVIGITTMYLKGGQNLNFAVPVNYLLALNNQDSETSAQLTYSSEDLELKKELAEKYYEEAEYADAAKLFFEITEADSTDPVLYFKLGFSLHRIAVDLAPHNENDSRWENFANMAIDNFTKSVLLDPENEYGYLKIARVYGLWMIDAFKQKRPSQLREALINAQKSGGFFPFVLETNRAMLTSCSKNSILFTNGDDDTFPTWYLQEIEKVREDVIVVNIGLLNVPFYVKYLRDFKGLNFNLSNSEIENIKPRNWPRPRDEIIKLTNFESNKFNSQNLRLTINHSYMANDWDKLSVSDQLLLKIVKNYINTKDIYFGGITWTDYSVAFALYDHLVSEGLIKKIVTQPKERVSSFEKWENNLMKEYRYSIFSDPRIFGVNISYGFINRYRSSFNELAKIYHYRADKGKVKEILKFKDTVIPKENIPIPWDDLMEIYEDGELKKLYDFAGLNFKEFDELDEMSKDFIETSWEPAALDTPYYYYRIGEFYLDKKELSKSKQYIEEYLKYEPEDKRATASLMYIEFEENNYHKALQLANGLLEDDPENILLNLLLGNHFSTKKEYKIASKYFDKVLYVDDHDYDTYNSYGLLHLYQNDYQKALSNFEKVIEYSPSYTMSRKYALENIAETYKAMGDNKKSIEVYYELLETDPTMCLAYSKLSILYKMQGKIALSDDLLQIAKDNMWEDNYGQIGLACYYSHIGDLKTSLNYLETAIEMGFSDYSWLEFDPDLDKVRKTDEFWNIISE